MPDNPEYKNFDIIIATDDDGLMYSIATDTWSGEPLRAPGPNAGMGVSQEDAERGALLEAQHEIDMIITNWAEDQMRDHSSAPYAWIWEDLDLIHDYPTEEDREALIMYQARAVYDTGEWQFNFAEKYGADPVLNFEEFIEANEYDLNRARRALSAHWDQLVSESMA